ncbi:MAG: hypothetical protein QOJ06_2238 [Pseudonocardiales bacterium]|nr:hypothetical protein [Pseudonocardiales bacterium]
MLGGMALFRLLFAWSRSGARAARAAGRQGSPAPDPLAVQNVIIIAGAHVADSVLLGALAAVVLIVVAVR